MTLAEVSGFIFRADNYIVKSYKLRKDSSTKKYRKFMFIVGLRLSEMMISLSVTLPWHPLMKGRCRGKSLHLKILLWGRVAQLVAAWQPGCEKMEREGENEE